MENIDQEITELEAKLQELKKKRDEEAKKLTITISKFNPNSGKVHLVLSKYRADIVDWLRYKTDRIYSESVGNIISVSYLQPFLDYFAKDDSIKILWETQSLERYEEWKTRPDILVELDKSKPYVNLTLGPRMTGTYINLQWEIPSFTQELGKGFRFSIAEFYLFPKAIETYSLSLKDFKLVYSDDAQQILISQLEKRKVISELGNATDADIENPLKNGYDLKPHQRVAVKFTEVTGFKSIIAYDMGTGKTFIAMGLAERHPEWKKILIICPATLKTNWKREIEKATGSKAHMLSGVEPDGVDIDALLNPDVRYYIINYDIVGRAIGKEDDKVMKWVELLNVIQPDLIVADEVHYIKNMESSRSKGVRSLKYKNCLMMSGTPLVNRPVELYPVLSIVAPETFNSSTAFMNQFTNNDGTARNVKKLHDMMLTYMIRRTRKDVYGDTIHIERIPFTKELTPQARVLYQKILEGIYISLRKPDYQRNVTSIFAELIRCKQTCSADNISTSAELARDAYEETEKKVLIFSQFKDSQYGLEQLLGRESCVVNGDVVDDNRYSLMDKFQDPKSDLKFWITNILEGLTLTEGHTVIFNDIWWTPKDHSQAEGRCFGRDNDPHGGNSYWLENENTIDQFLNALLMKKTAVFNEVIDGVRDSQEETQSIMGALINHLRESM